jgi:CRP/FNR family transcriptional regulator, cyclic AMP receptor protein
MEQTIDSAQVYRFSCFQSLSRDQIAILATCLEEVYLPSGKILFEQDDSGDSIYLLLSGRVTIKLGSTTEDERTLATLEAGAIFGEMGPLANTPRTATATAAAESRLWRISKAAFYDALQRGDGWATSLLLATAQVLGRRLAAMNEELVKLSDDLHQNASQPHVRKAVAEIELLRKRLTTEWTF